MERLNKPIIMTAQMGPADFAWADSMRRRHFPPERNRMELADRFAGLLVAQDQQTPRLHITVQNKVTSGEARRLFDELSVAFEPRPLAIHGIGLHYYVDGPWRDIGNWSFRGR